MLEVRPLNNQDKLDLNCYGCSMRGIVGTKDDEIIIVAGVMLTDPLQAFSYLTDEARKHPRLIVRMMREFKKLVKTIDAPVYAIADEEEHNSERVLQSIGFKKKFDRTYAIGGR